MALILHSHNVVQVKDSALVFCGKRLIASSTMGDTNGATKEDSPPVIEGAGAYEDEEALKKLADIIRQKLKIRHGVLQENRVEDFKGEDENLFCAPF